jgi:hypothetical protein
MTIKTKLATGTTILFLLILALGIIGTLFINRLAEDSGKIIQDNYASLGYIRDMQKALNKMQSIKRLNSSADEQREAKEIFEKNLVLQKKNITESGEKETVEDLISTYQKYAWLLNQTQPDISELERRYNSVLEKLNTILNINMNAMNSKNMKAKDTAEKAILYMGIIGACAIILLR